MPLVYKTGLENVVVFNVNMFSCFLFLLPVTPLLLHICTRWLVPYCTGDDKPAGDLKMRLYIQWVLGRAWSPVFYYLLCFLIKIIKFFVHVCVHVMGICVGQKTPCGCQFFLLPHGTWGSSLGCQVRAWCWSRGQQQDRGCVLVLWFSHYSQCSFFFF